MKKPTTAWAVFCDGSLVSTTVRPKKDEALDAFFESSLWFDFKDKNNAEVAKVQITKA